MVERHRVAVARRVDVGADPERLPERAADAHQEPAGVARARAPARPAARRPAGPVQPAVGGLVAAFGREHAAAGEPEVSRDEGDVGVDVLLGRRRTSPARAAGRRRPSGERRRRRGRRARAGRPTAPRAGRAARPARQVDDLVDGDDPPAGHPGDGDGPAPADVARQQALEEVGDDPLLLGLDAEVLADEVGARPARQQRRAPGRPRRRMRGPAGAARRSAVLAVSVARLLASAHGVSPRSGRRPRAASWTPCAVSAG